MILGSQDRLSDWEGGVRRRAGIRSTLAVIASAVVLLGANTAIPAHADPSALEDAKAQVKKLDQEASEIGEEYAQAKERLAAGEARIRVISSDIEAQRSVVDDLSERARAIALLRFQNRGIDTTLQLLGSGDPDTLLDRLSTASKVDENMTRLLQDYQAEEANLADLKHAAEAELAALGEEERRIAGLDERIKAKVTAANALMARLTEEQRAQVDSRGGTRVAIDVPDDGSVDPRALAAVRYAVSKVPGGNYVWGAEGPTNFDCSGLMLAAYRSVGVSLPHSSRAQYGVGRPVARANLKPGDLIFWYNPIHHVGMYIGGGKIVHARNTRVDLVIQTLASYGAPYVGARRVLG